MAAGPRARALRFASGTASWLSWQGTAARRSRAMMQLQAGAGAARLACRRAGACGGRGVAALRAARVAPPLRAAAAAPARAGLGVRVGHVTRKTKETSVEVKIDLDGTGVCDARSGIPFLDHMLDVRPARARSMQVIVV